MVNDGTHRSSSSSSTWTSSIHTGGTWAVRPTAATILTTVRRKSSRILLNDKQFRPQIISPQIPTVTRHHTSTDPSNESERTLQAVQRLASPPSSSPGYPTFQWIRGDLIGKGSYGRVYWALNITTGDIIAVKQVELASNPSKREKENVEALKFESNTLKELDHPNIVQFLGYEEGSVHISIFMEYIAGGSIGSCLKAHGRFNDEVTKAFTRQMLRGLEYLHAKGIIHRDIKADNILVDKSGVCKISDFGISKQAQDIDGRAFTGMRGTVYWMAPEAAYPKDTDGYDAKVDIWSIGCVVLEMWSGRRPWYGEELVAVLHKLCSQKLPPPVPADLLLSDEAINFREQAFARDPKERASAAMLRSHPYLVMEPGWIFDPACIEGPADILHTKTRSVTANKTVRRIRSNKTLPPVPIPTAPSLAPYGSTPGMHPDTISSLGPPIVFITPPSSPARSPQLQIHDDNISSPSTTSSSRLSSRRKRSFHVTNPDDTDFDENRKPFIYYPPPLPDFALNRLSQLQSSTSIHNHHIPRRAPSTPVLRTQPIAPSSLVSRSKHASSIAHIPVYHRDSDDETNTGSSIWQRAPQSSQAKRLSAWERPYVEDIYEHLQQFFPHHDIDQPIVNEVESVSPYLQHERKGALQPKKSIRMVAEQRADFSDRKARRVTKLWGSHLEELGGTKP